jgi:hypothetical protein
VYVKVPAGTFGTVVVVPEPVLLTPLGFLVSVHVPVSGNPLSATLPVEVMHVGWVMVPITGAAGVAGCALTVIAADDGEVQPVALVTVNVYVPGSRLEIVVLAPEPVVTPPGVLVSVHVPDGKPVTTSVPVETRHVGCVIVP